MTPERWERVKEIYDSAFHVRSAELTEFLNRACVGDQELRREVELLLRSDRRRVTLGAGRLEAHAAGHPTGLVEAFRTIAASVRNQTPLRIRFVR
jgi:hypothetical protein